MTFNSYANPITTVVNGTDISRHLRSLDWTVTQNFGRSGITAHLVWTDDFGSARPSLSNPASGLTEPATVAGTPTFYIAPLHTVVMKDANLGTTLFAGIIVTPQLVTYGPTWNEWQCDCIDWTTYADNILVQGTWLGNNADDIVRQLVGTVSGAGMSANRAWGATVLTTNNVLAGPPINKYRANYIPLSTALAQLARLSSTSTDYAYFIDFALDVHFFSLTQTSKPVVTFSDEATNFGGNAGGTVTYTSTTMVDTAAAFTPNALIGTQVIIDAINGVIGSVQTNTATTVTLTAPWSTIPANGTAYVINGASTTQGWISDDNFGYAWDGGSLRNDCVVQGSVYQSLRVDTWTGTGGQPAFPLTFNPNTNVAPRLTVGGVTAYASIVTDGSAATITAAGTAWVIAPNKTGQYFLQTATAPTPARGAAIVLRYTLDGPIIARARNLAGQAALGGTNKGIWQMGIVDTSLINVGTALARGKSELQEFQYPQERITFDVVDNFPGHINAGDVITISTHRVPDSQNSYSLGFTKNFLINELNYVGTTSLYRKYTITAIRIS